MYALFGYVNPKQKKKEKKKEIALLFSLVEFKIHKYIILWC